MTGETQEARDNRGPFAILFGVSVATALGNTGMLSVLPAIGRQIGIPDAMVAAIFSLSAVLWAITSPIWARQSDIRGRKPLILLGLGGFCLSMSLCAIVVSAGLRHVAAPMVIFVLFLLSRAIFGGPIKVGHDGDFASLPAVSKEIRWSNRLNLFKF